MQCLNRRFTLAAVALPVIDAGDVGDGARIDAVRYQYQ